MGLISIYALYKRRPLFWLVLALITGILIGHLPIPYFLPATGILISFCLLIFFKDDHIVLPGWLFLIMCFGCYQQIKLTAAIDRQAGITSSLHESSVKFKGVVADISVTPDFTKYEMVNIYLNNDSIKNRFDIKYHLYLDNSIIAAATGDTVSGQGVFYEIGERRNPGEFDFRSFFHRKGIYGRVFTDREYQISASISTNWTIDKSIESIREQIKMTIQNSVLGPPAGLLIALILGDKSAVDPEVKSDFIETGVVHVLAVSGLHVGYVVMILMALVRMFRVPWGWDKLAVIMGLVFFVALTGFKPSVVRAAIMAGIYILAPVFNRPSDIWNIVSLAAFVILLIDPGYLGDLGFQMSFLAVISIVYFYNLLESILPEKLKVANQKNQIIKIFWGLFLVSFSAQIGTLPLTVYHFGRIPIIALVANIFVIPLIGIIVALGFALILLCWIPFLATALGNTIWLMGSLIILLTENLAEIPYATVSVSAPGLYELVVYVLLITAGLLIFQRRFRTKAIIVGLILINLVIWKTIFRHDYLDVVFLDVGQGDAIIIKVDRQAILIDAGERFRKRDMGDRVVVPVARYLGINHFDLVVMTHPHNDHIGGILSVLKGIPTAQIWDSKNDYESGIYAAIHDELGNRGINADYPQRGEIKQVNQVTVLQVLAPDTCQIPEYSNVNNSSIVIRLMHGRNSFLFTGDLEHEGEELLYPYGDYLNAQVLKVAHHGSITSTTSRLLNAVNPHWAVISVGHKNKFRHPSPKIINRLQKQVEIVKRTDIDRAIWLRSDGYSIRAVKWQ